jgi:pimeloyl-ACP methyl ester carboxylesterase
MRSLTLVGATGLFPIGAQSAGNMATRMVDRSRGGIGQKLRTVMFDASRVTDELIDEEFAINNSPGATEAFERMAAYFRGRLDEDAVGEKLAELQGRFPKILVWGAEDRSVPLAVGKRAAGLLSDVPLHVIERAAHAPYLEAADEFNGILGSFLKQAAIGATGSSG